METGTAVDLRRGVIVMIDGTVVVEVLLLLLLEF